MNSGAHAVLGCQKYQMLINLWMKIVSKYPVLTPV